MYFAWNSGYGNKIQIYLIQNSAYHMVCSASIGDGVKIAFACFVFQQVDRSRIRVNIFGFSKKRLSKGKPTFHFF